MVFGDVVCGADAPPDASVGVTIYYIDPTNPSAGAGTRANPYQSFASLPSVLSDGDVILGRSGTTIKESLLNTRFVANNLRLGVYGGSGKFTVDLFVTRADWTYDSANDVWYRDYAASTGPVLEDGRPLVFVEWSSNIATTRQLMTPGSWAANTSTHRLYILPTVGVPGSHRIEVAEIDQCYHGTQDQRSGLTIEGWHFRGSKYTGFVIYNTLGLLIQDCDVDTCGGGWAGSYRTGNGFQISHGCHDFVLRRIKAWDIFDSAISPQVYTTEQILSGGLIEHCEVVRSGLCGIETSLTLGDDGPCGLEDITIRRNVVRDSGRGWSGIRFGTGTGLSFLTNVHSADHWVRAMRVVDNKVYNCTGAAYRAYRCNSPVGVFSGNDAADCQYGFWLTDNLVNVVGSNYLVTGNRVVRCGQGARVQGDTAGSMYSIDNNTFAECPRAISIEHTAGAASVQNNIIVNCVQGVIHTGGGAVTKNNNTLDGNTTNYGGGLTQGTDALQDPKWQGDNYDRVGWDSPCRRAGVALGDRPAYVGSFARKTPSVGHREFGVGAIAR